MPLWPWRRKEPAKEVRDERVVAAEEALREWAARLEAPAGEAGGVAASAAVQSPATARGEHLVKAVEHILALPPGDGRSALIDGELRRLLPLSLLPGAERDLEAHLQLVRDAFDNKDLQDALAGTLAANARDPRLEQLAAAAEAGGGEDRFERLAVACQQATSLGEAEQRCEEVLRLRRLALHQADMLLGRPKRAATQHIAEASDRKRLLTEQQSAVADRFHSLRMVPLEEEALALERELQALTERQQELRSEMDSVSQRLDEARERQRSALQQAWGWRKHLDEVRSSKAKSQLELASEAETVQRKRAGCTDVLDAVQAMREAAKEALPGEEAEVEELLRAADAGATEGAAGLRAAADAWLAEALVALERWRAEDARAMQTLELLAVDDADAERKLPTRQELPAVLDELRAALRQREAVEDVESSRCAEAAAALEQLEPLAGGPPPSAAAPAAAAPAAEPEGSRLQVPATALGGKAPSPRPMPISDFSMEVDESLASPVLGSATGGALTASLGEAVHGGQGRLGDF